MMIFHWSFLRRYRKR